jgi:DNA end-binding protein Ku
MAARPYWTGQIRISLVAFKISLESALKRGSQIPLHEIYRETGERIHHQNVTEEGTVVEREDIVKGYELEDGEHVLLEEEEIDAIKLPSSDTLALENFIDISAIPPERYERPYFILPEGKDAEEIYKVIHEALQENGKAGIGQIAMRGREELCAVLPTEKGLLLETLRYNSELENGDDIFPDLSHKKLKSDAVGLAKQLVKENSRATNFAKFHDHYHEALRELIKAKKAHRKPRLPKVEKPSGKVVNFMDALRKSLKSREAGRKPAAHPGRKRKSA